MFEVYRSRSLGLGCEMWKSFSAHIFVKSGSIYVKPRPKWPTSHFTHIVKYIWSMFRFVIFVCNYPVGPHVVSATWPCTCLFIAHPNSFVNALQYWCNILSVVAPCVFVYQLINFLKTGGPRWLLILLSSTWCIQCINSTNGAQNNKVKQ